MKQVVAGCSGRFVLALVVLWMIAGVQAPSSFAESRDPFWVVAGANVTDVDLAFLPASEDLNRREIAYDPQWGWQVGAHMDQVVADGTTFRFGLEFVDRRFGFIEVGEWMAGGSTVMGVRATEVETYNLEVPLIIAFRPYMLRGADGVEAPGGTPWHRQFEFSLGMKVGVPLGDATSSRITEHVIGGQLLEENDRDRIKPRTAVKFLAGLGVEFEGGGVPLMVEAVYAVDLRNRVPGDHRFVEDTALDSGDYLIEDLKEESLSFSLKARF